jgi:hypothetical protein
VSASPAPGSQSVVSGSQNVVLANIKLDASQSGQDIRLPGLKIDAVIVLGDAPLATLSGCQLWNGTTALDTGSNVLNYVAPGANTITFDNSLTVSRGIIMTLAVACDVSPSAPPGGSFKIGVQTAPTVSGVQSGSSFVATITPSYSGTATIVGSAQVSLSIDPSSPSAVIVAAGQPGVTIGVYKIRSSNEGLNLTRLGLALSSGIGDVGQVYLYSGSTFLGAPTFTGRSNTAIATLTAPLPIPRDTDTLITVKADLAAVGVGMPGTEGDLVQVDPQTFDGTGAQSGAHITGFGGGSVAGVRLMKSFPTVAIDNNGGSLAGGTLMRFKVTADSHGSVGLNKLVLNTTFAGMSSITNVSLYGYSDSAYSQPIGGQGTGGLINSTPISSLSSGGNYTITADATAANDVEIPPGTTYYFELHGTVIPSGATYYAATTIKGDATFNGMTQASANTGNFVWSPNANGTSAVLDSDWANGANVNGFLSSGLTQSRTQ